jgi:hypothetical protein
VVSQAVGQRRSMDITTRRDLNVNQIAKYR